MQRATVVRAFGSGRTHVAFIEPSDLLEVSLFGSVGYAVALDPVVVACRVKLRESRGVVVVMADSPVTCKPCARLTGVTAVRSGSVAGPEGDDR